MTTDIRVSAALLGYSFADQQYILSCVKEGNTPNGTRFHRGYDAVLDILSEEVDAPVVEGYAGFPVDKASIDSKKGQDRNVGRVIQMGGTQLLITGRKSDGRYQVVNKDGTKTAKDPADLGVVTKESVVGVDADEIHEGLKQARKNIGMDPNKPSCWKGYKAKGTKTKGGKEVPDCQKEENIEEVYKGKHGQSDKEYADSRSPGGKMVSGDSKQSGAEYTHGRRVKAANPGMQPDVGGKTKPKSQGKMDRGTRADLQYRKANLKKESFDLDAFIDFDDDEFDTLTFEELELIAEEALLELDQEEGLLAEALDIIDAMTLLSEGYYDSAVAASKENAKTPEARAGRRNLRKEKMKAAVKSAASNIKKGAEKAGSAAGTVAGKAVNAAGAAKDAVKAGASKVGSAAGKAAGAVGSAAGKAASGAKKVARGAGEVAGAAAGGFASGYAAARAKRTGSASTQSSTASKPSSSDSSSTNQSNRPRLRDRIKAGLKRAIGGAARSVSRGARNVARRMGESYSWRDAISYTQVDETSGEQE